MELSTSHNHIDTSSVKPEEKKEGEQKLKKMYNMRPLDPIPEIEWWDVTFLPAKGKDGGEPPKKFNYPIIEDSDILLDKITHYIQHPI